MSFKICHLSNKYGKCLLDTATETGINTLKTFSKKVTCKATETKCKLVIADKIMKPKYVSDSNSRNVEEVVTPPGKREEIKLKKLRQML